MPKWFIACVLIVVHCDRWHVSVVWQVVNVLLANRCCVDLVISLLLLAYTGARTTYGDSLVGVRGEVVCRLWMSKMPIWSMLVSSLFNLEVSDV